MWTARDRAKRSENSSVVTQFQAMPIGLANQSTRFEFWIGSVLKCAGGLEKIELDLNTNIILWFF